MQWLTLSSHKAQPVVVDHCPDCRLVWFDQFESVQLDGAGWVRLLRTMERGAGRLLAQAAVARPACPACAQPLKSVRNRTRFGLFAALECPERHGHLHSHSGLLAERGLVRPLGLAERQALAQERHRICCLNCGALATRSDDNCSYCGTALVVIDLPRLSHSLRLRFDDAGPSPQAPGRHVAWACRGCGAALDPGRDASCSHCGHLVVALELPDIDPLLEAAEAEHAAAAEVDARRLARFPSTSRPRPPREQRSARPAAPPGWARGLMLAGWSPLLLVAALALALAVAILADVHWPPRNPAELLRAQPVGDDPTAAWAWVEAHRLIAPAAEQDRRALRRGLFDLQLRQLAGDRWTATATVGSLIDGASSLLDASADRDVGGRWDRALGRHLRPVAAAADAPLPAEAADGRARMRSVAPGMWVDADSRQLGIWALTVENTGPAALALSRLSARLQVAGDGWGSSLAWHCAASRGDAVAVLRPGQRLPLVCRTAVPVHMQEARWSAAVMQLRAGEPPSLEWRDEDRSRAGRHDAIIDLLVAEAAATSVPLDRFLRRHTDLRRGTPPLADRRAAARGPRVGPWGWAKGRWSQLSDARRQALVLTGLVAAFVVYCALARRLGERRAATRMLLVAAPLSYLLGRGEGAASVLLVGMYFGLTVLLAFGFTFAFRLYRDAIFRRFGAPA